MSGSKITHKFTPKNVLNDQNVIQFGKYKGRDLDSVIHFDPFYIVWLRNRDWAKSDAKLMELIKDIECGDLPWGKYKGKTLEWIMENDEPYMKYLYNSDYVRSNCPDLKAKIDKIYI